MGPQGKMLLWTVAFCSALVVGCGGSDSSEEGSTEAPPAAIPGASSQSTTPPTTDNATNPPMAGTTNSAMYKQSTPRVIIETPQGNMTVELDAEKAPLTTANFLMYVDAQHYDGTVFHEILRDHPQLIIGGAYYPESSTLVERGATDPIQSEATNGLKNERGTIAMARGLGVDSATCHFFLNVGNNSEMLDHRADNTNDYGYCVFGRITEGIDTLDKLGALAVHDTDDFKQTPVDPAEATIKAIRRAP